jgi:hypothetical protein
LQKAIVTLCALASKLPAQPTQNKTSGDLPSEAIIAIVGTCICFVIFKNMSYAL